MSWNNESVLNQINLGEDSRVEFKEAVFSGNHVRGPKRDSLADELAAMGNSDDGGALMFSISDKGEVQSLNREHMDALEKLINEICSDSIEPPLPIKTCKITVRGDANILVVEVRKSALVHRSPGGYFRRQGSSKRELSPEALNCLLQQRGRAGQVGPDEVTVPNTGPNTLDESLTSRFLSSRTSESRESLLSRLGLIREDSEGVLRATIAGILLSTPNPEEKVSNAYIQAVCYRGTTPDSNDQLDAATITGPLDYQIKEAVAFVVRNMKVAAYKSPARVDMPQYSERAIFEAIVNAVIHRDYSIHGSKIRLFIFGDRLELYSPGALPNTLTIESMRIRQFTRNEVLASLIGRLPAGDIRGTDGRQYFLERRGEGVPIIREQTRKLTGREPEYKLIDGSELCLTLPAGPTRGEGVQGAITVSAVGKPLEGVHVHVLYPNKTWKEAQTDSLGRVHFNFYSELPMTVFCAAHGYKGHVESGWQPVAPLVVELDKCSKGGSAVLSEGMRKFPAIIGKLDPILDVHDRMYVYARNVAIEGGRQQPVTFQLGDSLRLTDNEGHELVIQFIEFIGKSVLIDYQDLK